MYLTDVLSGSRLVEKTFSYLTSVTKECRKALTEQFERKHKGIPFGSVEKVMREETESWFAKRDPNIKLSHEKSLNGRPGEILVTYSGSMKDVHFKIQLDSLFTLAGSSSEAPSYLKNLNVHAEKKDFTK
jgi:hypothetical protein